MLGKEQERALMEPKFEQYMDEIQMPGPLKARIDQLLRDFAPLFRETPEQIFVSDLFDGGNIRRYMSVWLFSKNHAMEIKNFIQADVIDVIVLTQNIRYVLVTKNDFDFVTANPKSRLTVSGHFEHPANFQLQAAANNCMVLGDITRARILPNLVCYG